ncbi:MAG: tetratricopeptide repeat protein, partial [Magnetococcales bacterium]|nr:tetratricopeptide repeat protein [Magnetococcales bacterium]
MAINPNNPIFHCNLGNSLYELGRTDDAASCYQKAIDLQPDFAMALSNLALIQTSKGQLDEAIINHQKAIAADPSYAKAHYNLARCKKDTGEQELQTMAKLVAKTTVDEDKMYFNFAMGQVLTNCKRYSEAFSCFLNANRYARATFDFNINDEKQLFENFYRVFNTDFFQKRESYGYKDETAIFIIGMPRSGSTLIEQILATHPQVYGAG